MKRTLPWLIVAAVLVIDFPLYRPLGTDPLERNEPAPNEP